MKVQGLDGREYSWKLRGREVLLSDIDRGSGPHQRARTLLKSMFPLVTVLEEVPLPGSDGLRLDFLILSDRIAVEVHGAQHFKYTPHFHGNRMGFLESRRRDSKKKEWCQLNNIKLVVLPDTEDEDVWRKHFAE
jgi:hypothetical protein